MNRLLKKAAYLLTLKRIDERKLPVKKIQLSSDELTYFFLSTNLVISFDYNGQKYYFRESPKIYKKYEYFADYVDRFFDIIKAANNNIDNFEQKLPVETTFSVETVDSFKSIIYQKLCDKSFIKILSNTDVILEKNKFSLWEGSEYNNNLFVQFFGFEIDKDLFDIAICFLWFMRSCAANFKIIDIVKGKSYSHFYAVRSICSHIVADKLSLGGMIPKTSWCEIQIDNDKKLFGVICQSAPGKRMSDASIEEPYKLQKELLNLNVLDALMLQPDHGPNNYNVFKTDDCYGVCAFDNDNPYTFFPLPYVKLSLSGCTPIVNKKGIINRPYLDSNLVSSLDNIDKLELKKCLKPYLNFLQIHSLLFRINKLKKSIIKTALIKSDFMLKSNQWSIQTAKAELSDDEVLSYLKKAILKNEQKG